jgi:S-adenosylmethionine-diacylglycerol 3-amino-3-carboxypropyl transferase
MTASSIELRSSFDFVRYANCWEDATILVEALAAGPGKRYLSIASAGDNSLALLTLDPEIVMAVDVSGVQLACTELRKTVIQHYDYDTVLWFLGFSETDVRGSRTSRVGLYTELRSGCSESTRRFWDNRIEEIETGVIYHGKFERYFKLFRKWILPLVHNRRRVRELLEEKNRECRRHFYMKRWNTLRWRLLFRIFFSRLVMGRAGRDPEFFRYVKGNVGERLYKRVASALVDHPTHDNPYLNLILNGTYGAALPFYMRKKNFAVIKKNIDRLHLFQGTVTEATVQSEGAFDGCNLSDIFEYMDENHFRETARVLIEHCAPKARLVYWNMLVRRIISDFFPEKVLRLSDTDKVLSQRDQAFFYQSFIVDEVCG